MANNNLNNTENILVKVDQNNVILIDPNSVVDGTNVAMRNVPSENLVMYANLEADLIPRTVLAVSGNNSGQGNLQSVAKGTLNMLRNANGGDLDTSWTNSFSETNQTVTDDKGKQTVLTNNTSDTSAQTFGIESIIINVKGSNFIPQVNINFIDVRGKTLFDSPPNSPYRAFFHLPWPIFYLTVKGYYGKAIRYRLHLTKFNSKYNGSNGNFEISTTFVGSTYAFLNDIPLTGILNAPYMYAIESDTNKNYNPNTGQYDKIVSKSSKGYMLLKSVYSDYVSKGLLPKSFLNNPKTLREIISVAKTLDKILEREILDQKVDFHIFDGVKEFEKLVNEYFKQVEVWGQKHLSKDFVTREESNLYFLSTTEKNELTNVTGSTNNNSLESINTNYKNLLNKTSISTNDKINKSGADFQKQTFNFVNNIREIKFYFDKIDSKYVIKLDILKKQINEISASFIAERNKLQDFVEKEMNKVIKDPQKGIGFDPTIRNIFGVIMANADVYIKLLKDVHSKAYEVASKRKDIVNKYSDESIDDSVYPWPEIRKINSDKQKTIAYPGDPDLVSQLNSNDPLLWPEVDFVENYHGTASKRIDPLAEKEGGVGTINYVFADNTPNVDIKNISTLFEVYNNIPYNDKSISSIVYEIYERARYTTLLDSFTGDNQSLTIQELADNEFDNIKKLFDEDYEIKDILKTITNIQTLNDYVLSYSPFERYPYFQDKLPTTNYIKNLEEVSFKMEQNGEFIKPNKDDSFKKLDSTLKNFTSEEHRKSIYPFNSTTYLNYLNKKDFNYDDLNIKNILYVHTTEGLVSSPENLIWVKDKYIKNLFNQNLQISQYGNSNILNTPYFHKQLLTDFNKSNSYGKFVGSAYLLLNSLPFLDLEDYIKSSSSNTTTRMVNLFREVNASHYVPYHLILKWGSLYHRYKTYLINGYDILSGFTNNNITQPISGSTFFDNNTTDQFIIPNKTVTYSNKNTVGLHPFYDAIFHQIVNGYSHYNITSGSTDFNGRVFIGEINVVQKSIGDNITYTTNFVKNSLYNTGDNFYTLLPSVGDNSVTNLINPNVLNLGYSGKEQAAYRIVWEDELLTTTFSGKTFPSYNQYNRTYISGTTKSNDNLYRIDNDYRKILDLMGTFSSTILDEFENCFLDFSTEKINVEIPHYKFQPYTGETSGPHKVSYDKFQDLLKEIVTSPITLIDPTDPNSLINTLKKNQLSKLEEISRKILSSDNQIKITLGNTKEIIPNVWYGFANVDNINTFKYKPYDETIYLENENLIKLYVGEDIDGYYKKFFEINNIEPSEDNILMFRPLIQIFAGIYKDKNSLDKSGFQSYIKTILDKATNRLGIYLEQLTKRLTSLESAKNDTNQLSIYSGYNDLTLKLEEYNYFKIFNDKWVAGNSLGSRPLMEEFLFLDKANKDIGDVAYLSLDKLISLEDPKNDKANLYSVISMLIQGTGFDMRALPAYVNFYGTNFSTKSKTVASKKVAQNIFGTFLDVDYQESSPKIIIQYTGPTSKQLEMSDIENRDNKFKNDSPNLFQSAQSPLVVTVLDNNNAGDLYKSNKVVAFEVSAGDENQSMFKGISLDQSSQRETSESMQALENLGRSESGAGVAQMDVSLFDTYRLRAYTCEVTMLGNVMIQPTMYFYLKNIPMFRGSYWITDVSHNVRPGNITTTFKGTRIPYQSLPNPKDSFYSSFRVLFDKLSKAATAKVKENTLTTTGATKNEETLKSNNGSFLIDKGDVKRIPSGEIVQNTSGVNKFGLSWGGFNGSKYVISVKNTQIKGGPDKVYYRAIACSMGGVNYNPDNSIEMSILSLVTSKTKHSENPDNPNKLVWNDIKDNKKNYFYAARFDLNFSPNFIITAKTTFLNPSNNTSIIVEPIGSSVTVINNSNISGPIHTGPNLDGFGIALSYKLKRDLGLNEGQVVYFTIENDL